MIYYVYENEVIKCYRHHLEELESHGYTIKNVNKNLSQSLSPYNLKFRTKSNTMVSVERAFHGSKVFQNGKQFKELFNYRRYDIRTLKELRTNGEVKEFNFYNKVFVVSDYDSEFFYIWLYLHTLNQKHNLYLLSYIKNTDGFYEDFQDKNTKYGNASLACAVAKYLLNNDLFDYCMRDDFLLYKEVKKFILLFKNIVFIFNKKMIYFFKYFFVK